MPLLPKRIDELTAASPTQKADPTMLIFLGDPTTGELFKTPREAIVTTPPVSGIIQIPVPHIEYKFDQNGDAYGGLNNSGATQQGTADGLPFIRILLTHFKPGCTNDWLNYNPRIALFRYKGNKQSSSGLVRGTEVLKRAWVHPTDHLLGPTIYANAHYFGGRQNDDVTTEVGVRRTEWLLGTTQNSTVWDNSVPSELKAWGRKSIPLNLCMFYVMKEGLTRTYDNIRFGSTTYFPVRGETPSPLPPGSRVIVQTGAGSNYKKSSYYRFAYIIDNPDQTLFGTSPLLIGPMSDFICVYPIRSAGGDKWVKGMGIRLGNAKF